MLRKLSALLQPGQFHFLSAGRGSNNGKDVIHFFAGIPIKYVYRFVDLWFGQRMCGQGSGMSRALPWDLYRPGNILSDSSGGRDKLSGTRRMHNTMSKHRTVSNGSLSGGQTTLRNRVRCYLRAGKWRHWLSACLSNGMCRNGNAMFTAYRQRWRLLRELLRTRADWRLSNGMHGTILPRGWEDMPVLWCHHWLPGLFLCKDKHYQPNGSGQTGMSSSMPSGMRLVHSQIVSGRERRLRMPPARHLYREEVWSWRYWMYGQLLSVALRWEWGVLSGT